MYHGECYITQRSVPVIILVYYNKDFDFLRYYHYSVRLRWRIRLGSQRFSIIRFIIITLKLTSFQTGAKLSSILALFLTIQVNGG